MKKIFLTLLLVFPLIGYANKLATYESILNAIKKGKEISLHLDFAKCSPSVNVNASHFVHSIFFNDKNIIFSDVHFTRNNPKFLEQSVFEYIAYNLDKDTSNLQIKVSILDPINYEQKSEPMIRNCKFNQGAFFFST